MRRELAEEHEIAPVNPGDFVEESLYLRELIERIEGGLVLSATWLPIVLFRNGDAPRYPDGLFELLCDS